MTTRGEGGQTAALVKLKKQTRSTKMGMGKGDPAFPGPKSPGCYTFPGSSFPTSQLSPAAHYSTGGHLENGCVW